VFAPLPKHIPAAVVWAVAIDSRPTHEQSHRAWYKYVKSLSEYSDTVKVLLKTHKGSIAKLRAALVAAGEMYCSETIAYSTH
jgi:hypothetical protein